MESITHLGVLHQPACMGSARRLTCPSRDESRACHVRSVPRRSRDTGSRDQSQLPRNRRSRPGGGASEQIDQPENSRFAPSQGPRRKLSARAAHGAGGERQRESAQRATTSKAEA
eukprot:794593-Rhodomonas_salina.1